jgi:hypothetical protein
LRVREQGICGTTWCDAPVRHIDHVVPHAEGGATSLDNGQGLCARCNHAKQAPGWVQKVIEVDGRHAVETTTPTGHTTVSVAPAPPEPVRAERHEDASTAPEPSGSVRRVPVEPESDQTALIQPESVQPELVRPVPVRPVPVRPEPAQSVPADTVPAWTPAVGVSGPRNGRIPRSRYSIGRTATRPHGAIAYRPPGRREPARRRYQRRSRPDITWAHTPLAHTPLARTR